MIKYLFAHEPLSCTRAIKFLCTNQRSHFQKAIWKQQYFCTTIYTYIVRGGKRFGFPLIIFYKKPPSLLV